jgi:hypothetical protein
MDTFGNTLSKIGAVLGIIAFFWNVLDAFANYLHIDLAIEQHKLNSKRYVTALATVENTGRLAKRIDYALLLIGPEDETPVATAKHIAKQINFDPDRISFTNDISLLVTSTPEYAKDGQRALIPLPFFFSEQLTIGDETLKYRCTIDKSKLAKNSSYSVRFFIFGEYRLHRSTQDLFRVEGA